MRVFVARNDGKTLTDYFKMLESCCIDYDYGLKVDDVNLYDGLIIPGGIDIDPFFYHQHRDKTVVQTDKSFDEKQFQLLNLFYQNNKKVLGICRGQQLINVFFKGTLIQNINTTIQHHNNHLNKQYHQITNEDFMKELYGTSFQVNSLHHQAIDQLADGFIVVSRSDDGIIEAIRHKDYPIIAVQFHPEMPVEQHEINGRYLFEYFKQL